MDNNDVLNPSNAGKDIADMLAEGSTVQQVQSTYTTAVSVQVPRNMQLVKKACVEEARHAGDLFYYQWGTGKNAIDGPSVKLALTCARNFGNCAVVQRPMIETRRAFVFTTGFIDHETGFTHERIYRMDKKFVVYGKHDDIRKGDMRFQIGQSKSIRNVITDVMPVWIVDAMMDEAQNCVRASLEDALTKNGGDISKLVNAILKRFAKFGVAPEVLEARLEDRPLEVWGIDELVTLAGDIKSLEKRTETVDTLYSNSQEEDTAESRGEKPVDDKPAPRKQGGLDLSKGEAGDKSTHTKPSDSQKPKDKK